MRIGTELQEFWIAPIPLIFSGLRLKVSDLIIVSFSYTLHGAVHPKGAGQQVAVVLNKYITQTKQNLLIGVKFPCQERFSS